jgi:hypothetical protein
MFAITMTLLLGVFQSAPSHAAANAEQVVFSGIALPPASSEPFGFWIWCQVEPSAHSRGKYDTDCNGAIYFYARGITVHVTGEVSEPEGGHYEMDVAADDDSVSCTLDNVPPVLHGPRNTVTATCTVDGTDVSGLISNNAVVVATGP